MTADARAHWERARSSLRAAGVLADIGDGDGSASRAYYAAFHAVTALFLSEGQVHTKHSALEASVHRDLVKSGRVDVRFGQAFQDLR